MPRDDLPLVPPASVTLLFPWLASGAPQATPHAVNVTLAELALTEYHGVTGYDGSHVLRCSAVYTGANDAEIDALAAQAARDYYRGLLAARDIRTAGYPTPILDGLVDRVEVIHQPEDAGVRVLRGFEEGIPPVLKMHGSGGSGGLPSDEEINVTGTIWITEAEILITETTVEVTDSTFTYENVTTTVENSFFVYENVDISITESTITVFDVTLTIPEGGNLVIDGPGTLEVNSFFVVTGPTIFDSPGIEINDTPVTFDEFTTIIVEGPTYFYQEVFFHETVEFYEVVNVFNTLVIHPPVIPGEPGGGIQILPGSEGIEFIEVFEVEDLPPFIPPTLEAEDPDLTDMVPGSIFVWDGTIYLVDAAGDAQPVAGEAAPGAEVDPTSGTAATIKYTVNYTDLQTASTSINFEFATLPARATVTRFLIKTHTAGAGVGTLGLIPFTDVAGGPYYVPAYNGLTAPSATNFAENNDLASGAVELPRTFDFGSAVSLKLNASANINLSNLSAGKWEMWITYEILQAPAA